MVIQAEDQAGMDQVGMEQAGEDQAGVAGSNNAVVVLAVSMKPVI